MATIKELKDLALHSVRGTAPENYTVGTVDDALRGATDGFHRQRGKDKRQTRTDEQADQHGGIHQAEVGDLFGTALDGVDFINVGRHQCEGRQRGGANRKAFTGGGGSVAQRVERIGALTNFFFKTRHLGDTARVIRYRTVSVGRKGDAQRRQHTDSGESDAVETH